MKSRALITIIVMGLFIGGTIASLIGAEAEESNITWTLLGIDPEGDTAMYEGYDIPTGQPWADITKVEVGTTPEFLVWRMTLKDIPDTTEGDATPDWAVGYEFVFRQAQMQDTEFVARVDVQYVAGTPVYTVKGEYPTGNRPAVADHWEIDAGADTVTVYVKRADIGNPPDGTQINTIWVNTFDGIVVTNPGTDNVPQSLFLWVDHAIDGTVNYVLKSSSGQTGSITIGSDKTEQSVKNGVAATYTLTLSSNLTENKTVSLTSNTVEKWGISVSPASVTVPAGGTATATLSVTPSGQVAANEKAIVTVNATFSGGYATVTTTTTSQGGEVTNQKPVAAFTHAVSGLKVSVDAPGSSDPDRDALTYAWKWGDSSPDGSGKTAEHTYAKAGTYTISLTANDGKITSTPKTASVTVSADGGSGGGGDGGGKFIPGFEIIALIGGLGIAAIVAKSGNKKRW